MLLRTHSLLAAALLIGGISGLQAGTIVTNTGGAEGTQTEFFGQSFTTPNSGPFTDITFSFYSDIPPISLSAAGTAFLLSQAYFGMPSALGAATPGFLAQSTGVTNNTYVFDPSLTLLANTKYYLYTNGTPTASGGNTFPNGEAYFSLGSNINFVTANNPNGPGLQSANFILSGTAAGSPSPVPEPSTVLPLGLALGVAAFAARNRMRA